jgi:hypothetical protein
LREKIESPIEFMALAGDPAHGYTAEVFIEVCDAIIDAYKLNRLAPSQEFLGIQAEIIVRSAAKIGIIGLIDEATGFIADKRREEYRELWQQFIREECRAYEAEFPDRFFDSIYRLYGLKRKDRSLSSILSSSASLFVSTSMLRLRIVGELSLRSWMQRTRSLCDGGRRYKMFQFLSDEVGMPAFKGHLWQVVGIAASSPDKASFERSFYRAFPEALPRGSQSTSSINLSPMLDAKHGVQR